MPLQRSSSPQAFKTNVRTLMGEVGKSPHVQSRQQALAIAYETQRRAGRQEGGSVGGLTNDLPQSEEPASLVPMMPRQLGASLADYLKMIAFLQAMHRQRMQRAPQLGTAARQAPQAPPTPARFQYGGAPSPDDASGFQWPYSMLMSMMGGALPEQQQQQQQQQRQQQQQAQLSGMAMPPFPVFWRGGGVW